MIALYGPQALRPGQVLRDATIYCDGPAADALALADGCRVENVAIRRMAQGPRKSWSGVGVRGAGVENVVLENVTVSGFGVGIALDGNLSREATGRISIEKTFIDANVGVFLRQITDNVWLEKVHVHPLLGVLGDGASTNYLYAAGPAFHICDRAETINMVGCHSYGHPQGVLIDNPTPEHAPSVRIDNFNAESYPDPRAAASMGLPANSSGIAALGECYLTAGGLYTWGMESGLVVDFAANPWGNHVTLFNAQFANCYGLAGDIRRGEVAIYGLLGDKYAGNTVIRKGPEALLEVQMARYVLLT